MIEWPGGIAPLECPKGCRRDESIAPTSLAQDAGLSVEDIVAIRGNSAFSVKNRNAIS